MDERQRAPVTTRLSPSATPPVAGTPSRLRSVLGRSSSPQRSAASRICPTSWCANSRRVDDGGRSRTQPDAQADTLWRASQGGLRTRLERSKATHGRVGPGGSVNRRCAGTESTGTSEISPPAKVAPFSDAGARGDGRSSGTQPPEPRARRRIRPWTRAASRRAFLRACSGGSSR